MSEDNGHVEYRSSNGIGYVTFNRPSKLNAMTNEMLVELREALYALDDDKDALVGIMHGEGRAFSTGADVMQRQGLPLEELARIGGPGQRGPKPTEWLLHSTNWKPIIAATQGYVLGMALRISLLCDLIVASEGTQFRITEVERGLDGTALWALLAERGMTGFATEVALTGRYWSAEEAYRNGMVDHLTPPGRHLEVAEELARAMMTNPPLAVRAVVETRRGKLEDTELRSRIARPRALHLTEDFRESVASFAEKRPPKYVGR